MGNTLTYSDSVNKICLILPYNKLQKSVFAKEMFSFCDLINDFNGLLIFLINFLIPLFTEADRIA